MLILCVFSSTIDAHCGSSIRIAVETGSFGNRVLRMQKCCILVLIARKVAGFKFNSDFIRLQYAQLLKISRN